jgi:hypothetical protein
VDLKRGEKELFKTVKKVHIGADRSSDTAAPPPATASEKRGLVGEERVTCRLSLSLDFILVREGEGGNEPKPVQGLI